MKSLVRNIYNSNVIKSFRSTLNFHPLWVDFSKIEEGTSISDGLIWRTDNNFKTVFKFTDIFKLFYNINDSNIELVFYDHKYNFLKKINLKNINVLFNIYFNFSFIVKLFFN